MGRIMVRKSIRRALGAGLTSLLVVVGALAGQSPAYAADPDPGVDRLVALLGGSGDRGTRPPGPPGPAARGPRGSPFPSVGATPGGPPAPAALTARGGP